MKRALKWIGIVLGVLALAIVVTLFILDKPRMQGTAGEPADALARKVQQAMKLDAWRSTGAVRFVFGGRNTHLWDRQRGFARVRFGDNEVLLDTRDQSGIARKGGKDVDDPALVKTAWSHFINDTYWLYPFAGLFDEGTQRALVDLPGDTDGLLISYGSGGVTPGDEYLWHVGPDGRPTAWQMWVSILPIGGVEVSWDAWQDLSTGVPVSTLHDFGPMKLELTDVAAGTSLAALGEDDPFGPLVAKRGADGGAAGSQPTQ